MAATPASCFGRFWRVTFSALAALCILTGAAGDSCPPASPNPCFNAPGTASVCCPGACGSSTGQNGENATCADSGLPSPTMSIFVIFNYSDPSANCAGLAAAPGGGYQFGDHCGYNVPIVDSAGNVLGSAIYAETTVAVDPNGVDCTWKSAHTYFFGTNTPLSAAPDSLNFEGQTMYHVFQLPITGGTGKYLGAKGYYISQTPFVKTIGNDTVLYIPKDIYILN